MINFIIVGVGNLANKLIPALKRLDNKQVGHVIFVDIKPIKNILKSLNISREHKEWLCQNYHDISSNKDDVHKLTEIKKSLPENADTVVYLSTPPSEYCENITRFFGISNVFFIEKPWLTNISEFEEIDKKFNQKRIANIIGIDHYLWKNSVRRFIEENRVSLNSDNFDFVITENQIPSFNRVYYWNYGEISDMMPHVFPLLDKIFKIDTWILDNKTNIKVSCGVWNPGNEKQRKEYKNIIKRETFVEVECKFKNITIHIVLGKGIDFSFNTSNILKFFSSDKEIILNFENDPTEDNDAYDNIFLYVTQNIDQIKKGKYGTLFLNMESMKKYSGYIDKIQKMVNSKYQTTENERSKILNSKGFNYDQDKHIQLKYHQRNNCKITKVSKNHLC